MTYDDFGRVSRVPLPNGDLDYDYVQSGADIGRLQRMEYDPDVAGPPLELSYTYWPGGNLKQVTDLAPGNGIDLSGSFGYDENDRLTSWTAWEACRGPTGTTRSGTSRFAPPATRESSPTRSSPPTRRGSKRSASSRRAAARRRVHSGSTTTQTAT